MTAPLPVLRPLLPAPLYSWLDLCIPPLCLSASVLLHIAYNPQYLSKQAKLYWMKTYHARFLPRESQHAFQYSTINVGADLDALESGNIDLGNRWFAYNPSRWTLFAFKDSMFSSLPTSAATAAASARVRQHLSERSIPQSDMAKIYTVAMPAYAGLEGINPLVVHYGYAMPEQELRVVVLEVHNTFGERHIYVLRTGVDEDVKASPGHTHQWTFPRAFHVSPFNDRSGYYQVSLIDPLASSAYSIKIVLLQPDRSKKLMATLEGTGEPLSESVILRAAMLYPFSLILTSARILYQAFILHYFKKLNVFARPEPYVGQREGSNPVDAKARQGSIHWQQPDSTQFWLRGQFEELLRRRVQESSVSVEVTIQPADFTQPSSHISNSDGPKSQTKMTFHSYSAFLELFLAPTFDQALQIGSANGTWEVSHPELFVQLLDTGPLSSLSAPQRLCRRIRRVHHRWLSGQPAADKADWVDRAASWKLAATLIQLAAIDMLSYHLSRLLRADFVEGGSPWQVWDRIRSGNSDSKGPHYSIAEMRQTKTTEY